MKEVCEEGIYFSDLFSRSNGFCTRARRGESVFRRENKMVITQQLMVATQQLQGLRSLGLVTPRPGRHGHIALPISWNGLVVHGRGRGLAVLLTLLGAGSMGAALLALRYATGASAPISFFQSRQTLSVDSHQQQQQQQQHEGEEELTVPGLQNVGNNCFLNVVLQALASSDVLVSFMEECTKVSCSLEVQPEPLMMPLAGAVCALLKELAQSWPQQRTASPCRVMLALGLYAQHFDLATQQDAAEALAHLAAGLQEEREDYLQAHRPVMQSLTTVLGKRPLSPQLLQSWLHWPLEGTIASLMACQCCGFQFSTQFQFFNDIPLLPLRQADGNIIQGCTLEDCLDQFTAPEWVASVRCSHCAHIAASHLLRTQLEMNNFSHDIQVLAETIDKCSCDDDCACEALTLKQGGIWSPVHTNASKCLQIGRSPEVLCLQIQRAVMNDVGELKKLTGHVAISMVLDLFPYTVAAHEAVVKSMEMRSETKGDSLLHMLGQRSLTLSHIRMLQGVGYRSSLLNPESSLKGGSKLDEQEPDALHSALVESPDVAGEEALATDLHVLTELTDFIGNEDPPDNSVLSSKDSGDVGSSSVLESGEFPGMKEVLSGQGRLADPFTASEDLMSSSSCSTEPDQQQSSSTPKPMVANGSDSDGSNEAKPEKPLNSRKLLYELLSVVVHYGTPQSGHYTVYRKVRLPKKQGSQGSQGSQGLVLCAPRIASVGTTEHGDTGSSLGEEFSDLKIAGSKTEVPPTFDSQSAVGDGVIETMEEEIIPQNDTQMTIVWFKVSDTSVMQVEEQEVKTANASLVFYERIKG